MHGNGIIDVLLTRDAAWHLSLGNRVMRHHTNPDSGWVTIEIERDSDCDVVIGAMCLAYDLADANG